MSDDLTKRSSSETPDSWPDPRAGNPLQRLLRGFVVAFQGLGFMFEHPRLWSYALIPIFITLILLSVILVGLGNYNADLVALLWARPESWYWQILWYLLYGLIFALTFVIGAVSLPAVVSAPFLDALSERTEAVVHPEREKQKGGLGMALRGGVTAMLMTLGRLSFLIAGLIFLWLFGLIPVVGLVSLVLAPMWTMLWLSAENLEYAMGRHRHGFRDVFSLIRQNGVLCMGFGAGVFLFLLIPLLNLLFIPVGAVGGTLLFLRLEAAGAVPARNQSSALPS